MIGFTASAQNGSTREQFERELKLKNESVSSIKCHFIQTRDMSVLQNVVRKEGTFYFQRPGNMLLSFNDGDYIKMTEEWFEMKTGENTTTTKISSNPMLRNLSTILSACVVGDFAQMIRGFSIQVQSQAKQWVVIMTPQRGKAASKISQIVLHFDRETMSLNTLKMVEKSGDYTMYGFSNKQFNVAIDSKLFKIEE
ncbi:MAG: outer membrane lipoprotein carrier protein LolA [Alistipes sp.]|nr:outer membrane lipoprotein carrier protein LolA [Alistipes sp.]